VPVDRLPDPEGVLRQVFLPELQRSLVRWILSESDEPDLAEIMIAETKRKADRLGVGQVQGLRLPGRERIVPSLVLTGLGNPWLVAFCDVPGAAPPPDQKTLDQVLALETVEALVQLGLNESDGRVKIRMQLRFSDDRPPRLIEGEPISLRRRPKDDGRGGPARR
jgi:hypothetical protein